MAIIFEKKLFVASLIFKNNRAAVFICDADSETEVEKIITQQGMRQNLKSTFIVELSASSIGRFRGE